jgi:CheY-like chemotaxis protein
MSGQDNVLFIEEDSTRLEQIKQAEQLLGQAKIHFAGSGPEAIDLLTSMPDIPLFIVHNPPELDAFDMTKSLSGLFPESSVTILMDQEVEAGQDHSNADNVLLLPIPAMATEYALVVRQGIHAHRNAVHIARKLKSVTDEKTGMQEATRAIMKSYQDLSSLVHCGQQVQETMDLNECNQIITDALKTLGLDCTILLEDDEGSKKEIRRISEDPGTHFEVADKDAKIYFADHKYAGYIDAHPANGESFDVDRLSDPLHLIRNQLMAFLDRYGRIEEKEQLLEGYKAILNKLEEIIKNADVSRKTQKVRKELESDTESIFNILDKMREKVSEDVIPWVDEVELSLQFADRVSQQINSVTSILRELLGTINPSLEDELEAEKNESTQSVLQEPEEQKSVDDLLESLGM